MWIDTRHPVITEVRMSGANTHDNCIGDHTAHARPVNAGIDASPGPGHIAVTDPSVATSQSCAEIKLYDAEAGVKQYQRNRELEVQITELAGHLNAGTYRFLSLIAEFDRGGGWADGATQSCAHWLNWRLGIDMGAAREKVRVAHALAKLPLISAAMSRGQLSYSKVRALTRVATPAQEETLLNIAIYGTAAHVEKLVRLYRRCLDAEELSREAQQQATRMLSWFFDEDGSLVLKARLPAEAGAVFIKALEAAENHPDLQHYSFPNRAQAETQAPALCTAGGANDPAATRPPRSRVHSRDEAEPDPDPQHMWRAADGGLCCKTSDWQARRADALSLIAEAFLQHGLQTLSPGDRQQIVVHVDAQTLRDGTAGRCEIEHGPAIAAETARRLACDASVVTLLEDENGEPLDIGRKTRTLSPAIRRALNARDQGCRFPGCPNARYLDAHHIRHWAHGGETKLSNLVQLCRFHHRQVHEGKVRIQRLDDGALRFLRPEGGLFSTRIDAGSFESTHRASGWEDLAASHARQGLHIDPETATNRWSGEKMDYDYAISILLQNSNLGVSAETS